MIVALGAREIRLGREKIKVGAGHQTSSMLHAMRQTASVTTRKTASQRRRPPRVGTRPAPSAIPARPHCNTSSSTDSTPGSGGYLGPPCWCVLLVCCCITVTVL